MSTQHDKAKLYAVSVTRCDHDDWVKLRIVGADLDFEHTFPCAAFAAKQLGRTLLGFIGSQRLEVLS